MRWWARPLFDHNFHRAHRALRLPLADGGMRRYHHRSPAMALGLTDHRWSFAEYDKLFTAIKANNEPDPGMIEYQLLPTFETTGVLV